MKILNVNKIDKVVQSGRELYQLTLDLIPHPWENEPFLFRYQSEVWGVYEDDISQVNDNIVLVSDYVHITNLPQLRSEIDLFLDKTVISVGDLSNREAKKKIDLYTALYLSRSQPGIWQEGELKTEGELYEDLTHSQTDDFDLYDEWLLHDLGEMDEYNLGLEGED